MTWRGRNIYLVGLPGAGKSAIGEQAASLLAEFGYDFIDLDHEIERRAHRAIGEIFEAEGEAAFRSFESEALLDVSRVAYMRPKVVATGGGAVLSALNRTIMRGSGLVVWIDVSVREAAKNIQRDIEAGTKRPLIASDDLSAIEERLRTLLEARRPYYEQATLHFVYKTTGESAHTPLELAEELKTALTEMSFHVGLKPRFETLVAQSALRNYPVLVGNGIAAKETAWCIREGGYAQAILVTDSNVDPLHRAAFVSELQNALKGIAIAIDPVVIEAGEASKSLATLTRLLESFAVSKASRKQAVVIALGGGVVTDVAALAANLYHRGLPLIHIPTTLLAQVDAAIGGKTGVDAFGAKNTVGTFYPPSAVIVDPLFLQTLPKRELHAGLAELLKYGLIGSRDLWSRLSNAIGRLVRGIDPEYPHFISEAILQKLKYVERDEFERASGIRELLNFGHTFGHALEAATEFGSYIHGEAVLLGMRTAAWLSCEVGTLNESQFREIDAVLSRVPIEGKADVPLDALRKSLSHDKKRGSDIRFILLRGIGNAYVTPVSEELITRSLEYMRSLL